MVLRIDLDFEKARRNDVIHHFENEYGQQKVCQIGTFTYFGLINGLKDVCRVYGKPFDEANGLTKALKKIIKEDEDAGSLTFKDIKELKDSEDEDKKKVYQEFLKLKEQYSSIFDIVVKLDGVVRSLGSHASGVLITPCDVTDYFPTRLDTKTGKTISLYTGVQLEELNAIKYDILGLKTLDMLTLCIKYIDKTKTLYDYYEKVDVNDTKVYKTIFQGKMTNGVFQFESDLFKGLCDSIKPNRLEDLIAMTSIARPGPLQAGMHIQYANRKNGKEEIIEPLPNTKDLIEEAYCTIIYQESIMLIAKRVADFNDNQADSYLRKATA